MFHKSKNIHVYYPHSQHILNRKNNHTYQTQLTFPLGNRRFTRNDTVSVVIRQSWVKGRPVLWWLYKTLACHHWSEKPWVMISSRDILCTWHLQGRPSGVVSVFLPSQSSPFPQCEITSSQKPFSNKPNPVFNQVTYSSTPTLTYQVGSYPSVHPHKRTVYNYACCAHSL